MPHSRPSHRDDFEIAIICALPLEYDAVFCVFDEFWDSDGDLYGRALGDPNSYTTGRIGDHNVVLALLPYIGKVTAATAAANMRSSYVHLRLALLVGVCGGVPLDGHDEIFLGDVVISQTVLQYDFGRQYSDKFARKDTVQDSLGRPNKDIRSLVATFQTDRGHDKLHERVAQILLQIQTKVAGTMRGGKYDYPGVQRDQLFAPQHRHKHYSSANCICRNVMGSSDPVCDEALGMSCADLGCDDGDASCLQRVRPQPSTDQSESPPQPEIHIGVVASGDLVLKSAVDRERLYKETRAIAFEMEGAGVWDEVPCIVVKAVCDYADSHKHTGWQYYAAATAASACKAVLERRIKTDKAVERKLEATAKPFSMVPIPRDPNFVERPAISRWVRETLAVTGRRAALVGLGGVGKSQIAIQYAHDVRQDDPSTWVLWVHGSSTARFKEAYQDIAERLKLSGRNDPQQNVLQLVYGWLADEENGPWLMIVDNADDGDVLLSSQAAGLSESERRLASYIPKTGSGRVLVTSRSMNAAETLAGEDATCKVPAMDEEEAIQLLRGRLGTTLCQDRETTSNLLSALDYLPLAIAQAASYIKKRSDRGATVATYLDDFHQSVEKRTGLLTREGSDLRRDESASNAVVTTWQITFNQVRRDRLSAAELLCFMSFFDPQDIPESVLEGYSTQGEDKDLEDDIEVLRAYSLIALAGNDCALEMHALVQFCTQVWLSTFDDMERWRCQFLGIMSLQYPCGRFENWTICRKLDPHTQKAIETCPTADADIRSWATLSHNAAWYRFSSGRYNEAEEMFRRTIEAKTKALGEQHPDSLISMGSLASVLWAQHKHGEAEEMNRRTLKATRKTLGEEHPTTLTIMHNLASVLHAQDKHGESEDMNRKTLKATRKALGAEHPDTIMSMNNLASVLQAQGKHGEAEEIVRRNLDATRKALGAEHPDTLMSMNNLAVVLQAQGEHGEAEEINRRTLEVTTKVLGDKHPNTLTSMSNLALKLWAQGKHGEAEEVNRRTLEARTKALGEEHPDTLKSMGNLAHIYWSRGQTPEALRLLRECIRLREVKLGLGHPQTQDCISTLQIWESAQ